MAPIPRREIAERAGVEPEFVDRLADLGILEPNEFGKLSDGDVQRVRIMQTLEKAGLPLDGLGEALRRDVLTIDFMDIETYDRWAALGDTTYQELSEDTGVPIELLTVIREALGFAPPEASTECGRTS